jgi:hypothetical protein
MRHVVSGVVSRRPKSGRFDDFTAESDMREPKSPPD